MDAYDYFYRRCSAVLRAEIPATQVSRVVITPNVDFQGRFVVGYTSLATTRPDAQLSSTGTSTGQQDIERALVR